MLGIVILNYKTYQETIKCVNNILSLNIREAYRIYVIDNDSPNESLTVLKEKYVDYSVITVISSGKNGGFSYGNNVGFKLAYSDGCDKILCTNNDVEFNDDSIDILCSDLDQHSECAVVGPKVLCANGEIQNGIKGVLTVKRFIMRHKPFSFFDWFGIEKRYTYRNYSYDKPIYVNGMVSGCCFIIRSSAIHEIGYLDENVFLYHEENILAAKLLKADYKIRLNPCAEVIHFGGKTTGKPTAFLRYHSFISVLYYFWHYTETTKFSFMIVCLIIKSMFFFKSITDQKYKEYYLELKKYIKELKKSERQWSEEVAKKV